MTPAGRNESLQQVEKRTKAWTEAAAGFTDLDGFWDLVDVLRLDDGPQVVLQDFSEVVLQLRTSEVGQDLLPVWRVLRRTKIREKLHKTGRK